MKYLGKINFQMMGAINDFHLPIEFRHWPVVGLHVVSEELFSVSFLFLLVHIAVSSHADQVRLILKGGQVTT